MNAWDRRPDESPQAYAAFLVYRDLGKERTIDDAYRAARQQPGSNRRASGQWTKWSSKYEWLIRATAYDDHLNEVAAKAREKAIAAEERKWVERREELREKEWVTSRALLLRATEMLTHPLTEQRIEEEDQGDGVHRTTIIKPVRWTLAQAALMVEAASKLGRLSTELETERHKHQVNFGDMQDDELQRYITELAVAMGIAGSGAGGSETPQPVGQT